MSYRARVGGPAAVGIVAAHWLTYVAAAPGPDARHAMLHSTGHKAWPYVVALALGAFAAWAARFVRTGLRGGATPSFRATAARLAVLQGAGWLALEASERVLFGHGDGHWHVVALGLAVQLVLAVVGAALCRVAARVLVALCGRRPAARLRAADARPLRRIDVPAASRPSAGGIGLRGPPRASTA